MHKLSTLTAGAALTLVLAAPIAAQQKTPTTRQAVAKPQTTQKQDASATATVKEERPGLLSRATVKPDSARMIATKELPSATFTSQSIRERSGRLMYVFRLKPAKGQSRDVMVDAMTGAVIPSPAPSKAAPKKGSAHAKGKGD